MGDEGGGGGAACTMAAERGEVGMGRAPGRTVALVPNYTAEFPAKEGAKLHQPTRSNFCQRMRNVCICCMRRALESAMTWVGAFVTDPDLLRMLDLPGSPLLRQRAIHVTVDGWRETGYAIFGFNEFVRGAGGPPTLTAGNERAWFVLVPEKFASAVGIPKRNRTPFDIKDDPIFMTYLVTAVKVAEAKAPKPATSKSTAVTAAVTKKPKKGTIQSRVNRLTELGSLILKNREQDLGMLRLRLQQPGILTPIPE